MNLLPFLLSRRRHKRLTPQQETVVYTDKITGQVIDLSREGLAFTYESDASPIEEMFFELNIMCCDWRLHGSFFCRPVADIVIGRTRTIKGLDLRRCSVQFGPLTPSQQTQLEQFLKVHGE